MIDERTRPARARRFDQLVLGDWDGREDEVRPATEAKLDEPFLMVFDLPTRRLDVAISEEEMARRLATWSPPPPRYPRGVFAKYAAIVSTAARGAVTS